MSPALNPQAQPGHLCIYESSATNRKSILVFDVNFSVLFSSVAAGVSGLSGSWAVTAP